MSRTVIFDLSEVLIAGLLGIEVRLSERFDIDPAAAMSAFNNRHLHDLFCGRLSEDAFIDYVIRRQAWDISARELKEIIRHNFHRRVPGTRQILAELAEEHDLVILSDHAAEWVEYIEAIHPFLKIFQQRFFSYTLGQTKRESSTFQQVLDDLGRAPEECIFIDDSERNIHAAISVGIPSVQFLTAEQLAQDLAAIGTLQDIPELNPDD